MIERVRLKNFRRYRDEVFELAPGLNIVEGPNNAGKTSLLYAIEYALFGRVGGFTSPRGLMSPKARGMGVELVFVGQEGRRYRLQRVHVRPPRSRTKVVGHFTLKQQEEEAEEERYLLSSDFDDHEEALRLALREVLGVTRRNFEVAVSTRQGELAQILAGAPQLDSVLGVTAAVVAAGEMRALALEREKAAAALPVLEEGLERMRAEREERVERIEALQAEVAAAEARRGELEQEIAARRAELEADRPLSEALAALKSALRALDDARPAMKQAAETLEAFEEEHPPDDEAATQAAAEETQLREEREALEAGRAARAAERSTLDRKRGDLAGRLARREELPEGADALCEACGQPIDRAHVEKEIPALRAELETVDTRLGELEAADREGAEQAARVDAALSELSAAARAREVAANQSRRLAAALRDARTRVEEAEQAVARRWQEAREAAGELEVVAVLQLETDAPGFAEALETALADRQSETREALARLEAEGQAAQARHRQATGELESAEAQRSRVEREIAADTAKADGLREEAEQARQMRALAAAFKSLQKELRERATVELAERTHALHRALSGGDEQFQTVDIDPAKYAVLVTPKDVGREVPAALYQGGGHRALLGLAFKLAVSRLVGACPFVLLDEPTDGLDAGHRAALIGRILELDLTRQMILITHHEVDASVGARRIRVEPKGRRSFPRLEGVN